MRTQEKLIYTNERGESIEFSPASSYHVNFKDVTGLSDVRNAIYITNSMGQDGDTYLGYRIESRDIDIVGYIKERDKQAAQNLRRKLNRILNPQYEATLTYVFGDFRRVIGCKIDDAPIFKRKPIFEQFTVSLSCLIPCPRITRSRYTNRSAAWLCRTATKTRLFNIRFAITCLNRF